MSNEIKETDISLIGPKDLAESLKVSRRHVYALASKGKIPAVKIGGSIRFRPSSILAWIQEQEKSNYGRGA